MTARPDLSGKRVVGKLLECLKFSCRPRVFFKNVDYGFSEMLTTAHGFPFIEKLCD